MANTRPDLFSDLDSVTDRDRGPLQTAAQGFLARFYKGLFPGVMFLFDWAGCNGSRMHPGFGPPKRLTDIWWHLPVYLVFCLAYLARLEVRRRNKQSRP